MFFLVTHYTFWYNMSGAFGILIAPLCGFILDYKVDQSWLNFFLKSFLHYCLPGHIRKKLNISILQMIIWICSMLLCLVCLFHTKGSVITALVILTLLRPILVAGSQALIVAV